MKKLLTIILIIVLYSIQTIASSINKKDIPGYWQDTKPEVSNGRLLVFKSNGKYEEYYYYNANEKITDKPKSTVWSGFGKWSFSFNVLQTTITSSASNSKMHNSYHIIKLTKTKMTLLNTAGGKRTYLKRVR